MLQQSSKIFNQEIVTYILQHRHEQSRFEIDRHLLKHYYLGHEIEHSWQVVSELHQVEPNPNIVSYIRWRRTVLPRSVIEKNLLESDHSLYDIEVAWAAIENNWQPKKEARNARKQAPLWLRYTFLAVNSLTIIVALAGFFYPWSGYPSYYYGNFSHKENITYSTGFGPSPYMFVLFGILLAILGLNVADVLIPSLATKRATLLSIAHFVLLSSVIAGFFKVVQHSGYSFNGIGLNLFGYGLFFALVSNGWSVKNEGFRLGSIFRYFLILFLFLLVSIVAETYFLHNWLY